MSQLLPNQLLLSYFGGLLAFLSPCFLPTLAGFISFMIGSSVMNRSRYGSGRVFMTALIFGIGLAIPFGIGIIPSSAQVFVIDAYQVGAKIAGVVILAYGAAFIYFSSFAGGAASEGAVGSRGAPLGLPGAFVVGVMFGAVWPHCLGPILGRILTLATVPWSAERGALLLVIYIIGLITAFALAGLLLRWLSAFLLDRSTPDQAHNALMVAGLVLAAIGVSLIFTTMWLALSRIFIRFADNSLVSGLEELLLKVFR